MSSDHGNGRAFACSLSLCISTAVRAPSAGLKPEIGRSSKHSDLERDDAQAPLGVDPAQSIDVSRARSISPTSSTGRAAL